MSKLSKQSIKDKGKDRDKDKVGKGKDDSGILAFFQPKHQPQSNFNLPLNPSPTTTTTTTSKSKSKKRKPEAILVLSDDSDIEIIDSLPHSRSTNLTSSSSKSRQAISKKPRQDLPVLALKDKVHSPPTVEEKQDEDIIRVEVENQGFVMDENVDVDVTYETTHQIADGWVDSDEGASREGRSEEDGEVQEEAEGAEFWGDESFSRRTDDDFETLVIDDDSQDEDSQSQIVQGCSKDLEEQLTTQEQKSVASICPICSKDLSILSGFKRDQHANICVDSTRTKPVSASSFKFFSRPPPASTKTPTTQSKKPTSRSTPKPTLQPSKPLLSHAIPVPPIQKVNAFTALMSTTVETKLWKEAQASDNLKGRLPTGEKRKVPFYKWVDGLEVTVDAFKYGKIEGCKGYFLSHAHSDHYQNLSSSWDAGPIYCSQTTANLIKLKLKVKDEFLHPLPMNETVQIEGISVTLIDANHCPGSVIILFERPHTDPKLPSSKNPKSIKRYLHCGDFRASPSHLLHPALVGKRIDICYLDTTYLDSKYCFPAQDLVINACSELVRLRVEGDESAFRKAGCLGGEESMMKSWLGTENAKSNGKEKEEILEDEKEETKDTKPKPKERLLVLVGTYSIGKERIVKGIANALGTKIYCDDHKLALFKAQEDDELHSLITRDPLLAQVHVVPLQAIQHEALDNYFTKYRKPNGFTKVIGLRPTGWTYRPEGQLSGPISIASLLDREKSRKQFSAAGLYPQRDSTNTCLAFGVPYSEHSSFYELTCFALSLNYQKMIPTVNVGSELSRKKMNEWFVKWQTEKKRRADAGIGGIVPYRSDNYW